MSCAAWCEGTLIADSSNTLILLAADVGRAQKYQASCVREMVELSRWGVKEFLLLTASVRLSSLLQTEVRAQKYQASCVREMVELCGVV